MIMTSLTRLDCRGGIFMGYHRKSKKELIGEIESLRLENSRLVDRLAESENTSHRRGRTAHRFRNLTEMLPQFVFEVDEGGDFTFVNRSGVKTLGYDQDDLVPGMKAIDVLAAQDKERGIKDFTRVVHGEKVVCDQYAVERKDGTIMNVVMYIEPLMHHGASIGARGVAIRFSGLTRLQCEPSPRCDALGTRVEERAEHNREESTHRSTRKSPTLILYNKLCETPRRNTGYSWKTPEKPSW